MSPSTLTCSYCGANIPDDSKNCPLCGAPVEVKPAPQQPLYTVVNDFPQSPVLEPAQPVSSSYSSYSPAAPEKKRSPALMIGLVAVVVVVLMACCGCLAFLAWMRNTPSLESIPSLLHPFLAAASAL